MRYERLLNLADAQTESLFLFGPRQVGKSTLLADKFPNAIVYDLLKSDEYARLKLHPERLRQELENKGAETLVIIDEIQKLPALLDEVHWLIVNRDIRFVLCGSSARKLKRVGTNLLGGRALRKNMFPLVSAEIPDFDLLRAVNNGMLPRHYMIEDASKRLEGYIGVYLKEEIEQEALLRKLDAFTRFLEVAAQSNGEIINYSNIAQDCGVSSITVKAYFEILIETLLGYMIPPFRKTKKRSSVGMSRFYYFDVGVANYLSNRVHLQPGSNDYGHAFEHLMMQELRAYLGYSGSREELCYWRTSARPNYEVDAIVGDGRVAIEFKSSREVRSVHTKGLKAFREEYPDCRAIIVSHDARPRMLNDIEVLPAQDFLRMLWAGQII